MMQSFVNETFENICENSSVLNIVHVSIYQIYERKTFDQYCCHKYVKDKHFARSPVYGIKNVFELNISR